MYEAIIEKSDSLAKLFFRGSLTIQNAVDIKDKVFECFESSEQILIDQKQAEEFDITYLQIILALQKAVESSGKKLFHDGIDGENFQRLLKQTGCKKFGMVNSIFESKGEGA